jgi:hypothetical protein
MVLRSAKAGIGHVREHIKELVIMLDAVEDEIDTAIVLAGLGI